MCHSTETRTESTVSSLTGGVRGQGALVFQSARDHFFQDWDLKSRHMCAIMETIHLVEVDGLGAIGRAPTLGVSLFRLGSPQLRQAVLDFPQLGVGEAPQLGSQAVDLGFDFAHAL